LKPLIPRIYTKYAARTEEFKKHKMQQNGRLLKLYFIISVYL